MNAQYQLSVIIAVYLCVFVQHTEFVHLAIHHYIHPWSWKWLALTGPIWIIGTSIAFNQPQVHDTNCCICILVCHHKMVLCQIKSLKVWQSISGSKKKKVIILKVKIMTKKVIFMTSISGAIPHERNITPKEMFLWACVLMHWCTHVYVCMCVWTSVYLLICG